MEIEYKGHRIVLVDYDPVSHHPDLGLHPRQAFVVRDEMDEPSLPTSQQWFWAPRDAMAAIDVAESLIHMVKDRKWPSTVCFEYNQLVAYRQNFDLVYGVILKARQIVRDARESAKDFGEDVSSEIEEIDRLLSALPAQVQARG